MKPHGDSLRRLLRTPKPYPDENLLGYLIRLTEANGYDSPAWIAGMAGMRINFVDGRWSSLHSGAWDLTPLEHLAGLDPGGLGHFKREAYFPNEGLIDFWGRGAPSRFVMFGTPKVCPVCLREEQYCRRMWDLLPVTACPAHDVVLQDGCARCGKRLSWRRSCLSVCPCGYDLRNTSPVVADPAALRVARQAYRLCGRGYGEETEPEGAPATLRYLSLAEFCQALFIFANQYRRDKGRSLLTVKVDNVERHEAFALAFRVYEDWPRNFHKYLDGYLDRGAMSGPSYLHYLHQAFEELPSDFIVAELENYCSELSKRTGRREYRIPLVDKRFARKAELCWFYNLSEEVLETCARAGQVRVFDPVGGGETLFDTRSVAELVAVLRSYPDAYDVSCLLDVSVLEVEDLVLHECLRPCLGEGVHGGDRWRFLPNEPSLLMDKVKGAGRMGKRTQGENLVSFGDLIKVIKKRRGGAGSLLRDVLDGKLAPAFMKVGIGLSKFAFLEREVSEYFRHLQIGRWTEREGQFDYKAIARALESLRDRNLRANSQGWSDRPEFLEINLSAFDLARVAGEVFSRAS